MKLSKIIGFFFVLVCSAELSAQSNAQLRRQAVIAERLKDWYSAAQYYQRLVSSDTNNLKLRYAYAESSRLSLDNETALRLYLSIAARDNGRRFPMSYYWIGQALKTKGDYKLAKQWFQKFARLKNSSESLKYYKMRARQEAENCDLAHIIKSKPVIPSLEHLDANINTRSSEFAPYELDSNLYFSAVKYPDKRDPYMRDPVVYSKIYKSAIRKDRYQKSRMLDTLVNTKVLHNANLTYNPAQDFMVMSRCTMLNYSDFQCDLYSSKLVNKRWSVPKKLKAPINVPGYNTTQPHLAVVDSQLYLFFSSNRPGGQGGMDIWFSKMQKNGRFSVPENAGKWINTPEDEITPWFVNSEQALYFSSTYHPSLGGFDIFRSTWGPSGFTTVENAGYPLNSGYNDLYYSVNELSRRAYLASNRPGSVGEVKNNCCNDIYRFRFDTLVEPPAIDSNLIYREKLRLLVPLTLYFHNDEPDPKTTATVTSKSYDSTYVAYMRLQPEYEKVFSGGLKKDQKQLASDAITNFFADSVSKGMEDLRAFVNGMRPLLEKGDTVKITLKGYCSPLASTNYNRNLARRRISSLRNYFRTVDGGILLPYIEGTREGSGRIIFEDVDIGELKMSRASDSFHDRRNSIFHPFAASERKIQIIAVRFGE